MLKFFNKSPHSSQEWIKEINSIHVVMGIFQEMLRENVRAGVLLALNDAFGGKK